MSLHGQSWRTYTAGYGRAQHKNDELGDAARTAALFRAENARVMLERGSFERALGGIVEALEEPIAASSIVPMYFVCQRARVDVKVVLMGQGPDELFGGYLRHLGVRYGNYWRQAPRWSRGLVAAAVERLPRNAALKRGVNSLGIEGRIKRYQEVFSLLPGPAIDELFREGVFSVGEDDNVLECWKDLEPEIVGLDELGGFQALELRSSLPDELLMYADKLSSAHGLEVRVPFLDREIVEYVQRLPARFKVRNGRGKWLHRKVCEKFLPREILKRKKRGFAVDVVDDWFKSSITANLDEYLLDQSSLMYRILDPKPVGRLLEDHRRGKVDSHKVLFCLVLFEHWLRTKPGVPAGVTGHTGSEGSAALA
jgi:asparagine synthase (glutamine-hydrolysing)